MGNYVFTLGTRSYLQLNLKDEQDIVEYNLALSKYDTAIEEGQRTEEPSLPHPYVKFWDKNTPSKTMVVSSPLLVSTNGEIQSIIVFRDPLCEEVDWNYSLTYLKQFVLDKSYTKIQTRACLLSLYQDLEVLV